MKRAAAGRDAAAHLISGLIERYGLDREQGSQLQALLDLVTSDPTAPTTIRDPLGVARDHLADSMVALELQSVRDASRIADLGAGAGFPGLPLAVALPRAAVSLVESTGRKCEFIDRAAEAAGIPNATAVHVRVEEWGDGRGACDLVLARALAPLGVVAEYAAPLMRLGATLLVWRGKPDPEDEAQGARAAAQLGLEPGDPVRVEPYAGVLHRYLHPLVKRSETPDRFPRRAGMARKRPLD